MLGWFEYKTSHFVFAEICLKLNIGELWRRSLYLSCMFGLRHLKHIGLKNYSLAPGPAEVAAEEEAV